MKKALALITLTLSVSGCATVPDFTPTMASDPPFTGREGSVLQTEMMRAFQPVDPAGSAGDKDLAKLCESLSPSPQERASKQLNRYYRGKSGEVYPFGCYRYRTATTDDVRNYVVSGMALTDYYCDIFFDRIAEHSAKRGFARGGVNDVGAAMSAILGLASAGSAITGGVGTGFGLLDSSLRNYDQAFLVDADLPTLQKLVRSEQEKIRLQIQDPDKTKRQIPETYQEAAILIMRYANTCSFTGMRGLLNASMLEKAQKNANPLDGSRIFDFTTLTPKQRQAMINLMQAQNELEAGSAGAEEPPH